jgi:hypothetical protein
MKKIIITNGWYTIDEEGRYQSYDGAPAIHINSNIEIDEFGNEIVHNGYLAWYEAGKLHRLGTPAVIKHSSNNIQNNFEFWHEPTIIYKIIISEKNLISLLKDFPEFGVYRKAMNIYPYEYGNDRCMYVNWFEIGHRELLEGYGSTIATINEHYESEVYYYENDNLIS